MVGKDVIIEKRDSEDSTTKRIKISGEISGERIKHIESEFLELLKTVSEGMVLTLNLKGVSRIDSRGISLIVGLFKECTLRKTNLVINADSTAFRILSQIKLDRVLTIKEEN